MKKLHLFKRTLLLLALIVGCVSYGWAEDYELYSGSLTEGDYIIVYDGNAMNTTVTSNRLQYETVTPSNNVITTTNTAIVWHIAPSSTYWTIYNATADKYAASTGAKNKAQMLASGTDDKSLWTVSGTETYEFVNKQNTANSVNANLRYNDGYGFACYATGTGGALSLYKKKETAPAYEITAKSNNITYGTVSLSGSVITGSPNSGYRYASPAYTVSPANSATVSQNGDNFTVTPTENTTVTINFEPIPTHTATFSVNGETSETEFAEGADIVFPDDPEDINGKKFVGWLDETITGSTDEEPSFVNTATMGDADITYYAVFATLIPGTGTMKYDNLTTSIFGNPNGYTIWSGKQAADGSDAVYAGESSGGSSYIQIRATSPSGIVTTTSGGKAKKVTVTWNGSTVSGRTLDIYGKNTAYDSSEDLYSEEAATLGTKLGSVVNGTSTELAITGDYEYIGMRSKSGAMYLDKIVVDWQTGTPDTYSAYCTTVSDKPIPTITFTKDEETITELNATATEMEEVSVSCTAGDVTITVESDDETVAEYVEGYVLAYKSGTATLTATFAGNEDYQGTTATLTVNVAKKATTTTVNVEIDDTDIYTATEGGLAAATVKAGDAIVTPAAVTWTSSATNVATIDAEGNITLVGVGTTIITASYEGTDVYDASQGTYELTLTSSEPQKTSVEITPNFEFYGKNAQFSGETYDELFGQKNNVSVTYTRNSGSTYANTTAMRFYKDNDLKISAPSGYHIIGITLTVSGTYSDDITTDVATYTTDTDTGVWSGDASSVTFSRPNNALSYVTISKIAVTLAPTVTISDKKFASYCSPHKLDFTETDVKAYKASVNNTTGKVTLNKVDIVPAEEGVILYCETPGTYAVPVTTEAASDVTGNEMVGVLTRTQVLWESGGKYNYILQQGQFNKANDGYLKANRAYLSTDYDVTSPGARALEIVFDEGETTSLREIRNEELGIKNAEFFNLNGQRVATPVKGNIYIVNGKKVMFK